MADKVVSTEFRIVDNASKALKGIKAHTHSLGESVDRIKGKIKDFSHSLLGLGAGLGVSFGLFETGKKIYEMGEFSETTHYRLAALAQSIGMVKPGDMAGGLKASNDMMKDLMSTANKTGINFQELASVFPQLVMQAHSAGVSMTTMKNLLIGLAPAAKLQGMSVETLGQNLQMAFAGRSPTQLKQLLGQLGMSSQQLIMMSRIGATGNVGAVVSMMQKTLSGKQAAGIGKLYSESSMARIENIKNSISDIYMTVGSIVEVQLDKYFEKINEWVKNNKAEISRVAKIIGEDIVIGMKKLVHVLEFVNNHWRAILATVLAIKAASTVSSIASMFGGSGVGSLAMGAGSSIYGFITSITSVTAGLSGLALVLTSTATALAGLAAVGYLAVKALNIFISTKKIEQKTASYALTAQTNDSMHRFQEIKKFRKLGVIGEAQKKNIIHDLIHEQGLSYTKAASYFKGIKTQKAGVSLTTPEKPPVVKPEQHFYGNIVIHQDFKGDALPDKVTLRFQADLEKLSEKQRISNVSPVYGAT